jgi:hypothetical protein
MNRFRIGGACPLTRNASMHNCSRTLLVLAVVLAAAGCGEPNPLGRRPVYGVVTFQGQPVDYGAITFLPADPQTGISSGAMIESGKYSIKLADGLPPGNYLVMVSSPDRSQVEKVEGPPGDERTLAKERIPLKYNLQTTLKLDVPKGRGRHEANFELK